MTEAIRKGKFTQTFTGRRFWPLDPRPEDVHPIDVAHQLAMTTRYAGATLRYYSVAEHCVHMSRLVRPDCARWALLHDAPEAWLNDMVRPLKYEEELVGYVDAEERVMWAVCERFGLGFVMPEEVKEADHRIIDDERRGLLASMDCDPRVWGNGAPGFGVDLSGPSCEWWQAKSAYLRRFMELFPGEEIR